MISLLSSEACSALEKEEIQIRGTASYELMQRAAEGIAGILEKDPRFLGDKQKALVGIICGSGNNGGDGFAVAKLLAKNHRVKLFYAGELLPDGTPDPDRMSPECRTRYLEAVEAGIPVLSSLEDWNEKPDFLIDAVFGTGLRRAVTGKAESVLLAMSKKHVPVVSVDIPSGINGTTGEVMGTAVRAQLTIAMTAAKIGTMVYPGTEYAGDVRVADIGIPVKEATARILEEKDVRACLPKRPQRSNKGTFGRVLVLAGQEGMCGAASFAARAAYRSGAGLVDVCLPKSLFSTMTVFLPEAILTDADDTDAVRRSLSAADAVVCGCGWGTGERPYRLLSLVLREAHCPLVLDADALNLLSLHPDLWHIFPEELRHKTVLTPHPGEMSRLCGQEISEILKTPWSVALSWVKEWKTNLLLKDAATIMASCDGEAYVNPKGNSGMATGGSGDVLAGVIGGLLAQYKGRPESVLSIVSLAAWIHTAAGNRAAGKLGEHSVMASDILDAVVEILAGMED